MKILLVEASGSKLVKLDKCITVADAICRIGKSVKLDSQYLRFYKLFIPLGAPLKDDDIIGDLDLQSNDILEFKKLPPHLLQRQSQALKKEQKIQAGESFTFPINILDWTSEIVCLWLAKIGYGEVSNTFKDKNIKGETLFTLTSDILRDGK